jgi:hypothetical protein
VTGDHPSRYWFGVEEVFFTACPAEYLPEGSSGSTLAHWSPDGTWNLGGQLVAGGEGARLNDAASAGPSRLLGRQLFLGNVPMLRQTLAIAYLQELIRRGMDPRQR